MFLQGILRHVFFPPGSLRACSETVGLWLWWGSLNSYSSCFCLDPNREMRVVEPQSLNIISP